MHIARVNAYKASCYYSIILHVTSIIYLKGIEKPHDVIVNDAIQAVREHLGPVVAFKSAVIVPALPKVSRLCKGNVNLRLD